MAVQKWQPAKFYAPGDLCVPNTQPPAAAVSVVNGDFSAGAGGWTYTGGAVYAAGGGYGNPGSVAYYAGGNERAYAENDTKLYVPVGSTLTARAMIHQGAADKYKAGGWVFIRWYDASDNQIGGDINGNEVMDGRGGAWHPSTVTSVRPPNAAYGKAGIGLFQNSSKVTNGDQLTVSGSSAPVLGLQYKAVQPALGKSDSSEPAWPTVLGQTVVDNEVIWEAVSIDRVTWEASPLYVTGPDEPDWPSAPGSYVANGTISFVGSDRRVTDPNCPQSKVVVIAKSKIYAGDGDVVRYSATLDATDWTSFEDAGYLGTGLQQNGANDVTVLNLYRGNLIVMNATTFQQWNIDPDPMLMDMLDVMDGIGSVWQLAAQPVANDLFYLSTLGVRTIGLSGATNNLKAGDVGLPVDPMVQRLVAEAQENGDEPLGMYYPASGQYWLIFNRRAYNDGSGVSPCEVCPVLPEGSTYAEAMVYTLNQTGSVGAWTRFVFPFAVDYAAQQGDDLYVRDGDTVYRLNEMIGACDFYVPGSTEIVPFGQPFHGVIWWPYLDMGQPGRDKTMESFDLIGYGDATIEVGYNQREPLALTEPYEVIADTLDGTPVPLTMTAPTFSYRLTYYGWQPNGPNTSQQQFWEFNALGVYLT